MILQKNISVAIVFLISLSFFACEPKKITLQLSDLKAIHTTASERAKFKKDLIETIILKNLATDLTAENEAQWQSAFWGMELALYRSDSVFKILKSVFNNFFDRSPSFQRAFIRRFFVSIQLSMRKK
ncbi:hypothetical protein L0Z72_00545 [candidate division KSB1 bacterium]|nr:hypothetical protein [candidate division KSB1 bacterium]